MFNKPIFIKLLILFALILPLSVSAQDNETYTVGILVYDVPTFITQMTDLGYIEGDNITYLFPSFEGIEPEQFAEHYQSELQRIVNSDADVLVVQNDSDAVRLRELTDTPIVFEISDDPIATGAIADLTTPGGQTTGVVSNQHHPRRLQLLKEVNPETSRVYYLYSSLALEGLVILDQVTALGEELGIEIIPAPIADLQTGLEALAATPEDADWIFLTPFLPFDVGFEEALVSTSNTLGIPIAGFIAAPTPGYLINYGPDLVAIAQQSAQLVDQVLRGAAPANLPVVIAENGFIVNLEVAGTLGVEIPTAILRQADSIVRPTES